MKLKQEVVKSVVGASVEQLTKLVEMLLTDMDDAEVEADKLLDDFAILSPNTAKLLKQMLPEMYRKFIS